MEPGHLTESWGVGERFGLVDIGRGQTYWFATKNAPEGESDEPRGRKAEVVRRFSGWHEPIAAIVEAAGGDTILRNDVYYLERLPRWSDGRLVLIGDAAHASTRASDRARRRRSKTRSCSPTGSGARGACDRARRVRGDPPPAGRGRPQDVPSRRQGGPAREPNRVATRNALIRRLPDRAQRRQLEPLVRYELLISR